MFKLESNRLKREFKITNGNFYASQIYNKYSDMGFVPDGNGCEFVVFFTDGTEVSSKGLPVMQSSEENDKLKFVFAEDKGTTVTVEYWVHGDGNTVCKQISISQNNDKIIDRVFLENIGIINSKTHFGIDPKTHRDGTDFVASLGQPFYIDSLFFGCVNPAVDCKIIHGAGQIRYYIGKNVGKDFKCPVTVMGGGCDNTMQAVQKAFFEYLDSISVPSSLRFGYTQHTEQKKKATAQSVADAAVGSLKNLNAPDMPDISVFEMQNQDWANEKGEFWNFNKNWQNGFTEVKAMCDSENTAFGIRFNAESGKKLAKKIQKAGNGFVNAESETLCMASARYNQMLAQYLTELIGKYSIDSISLDFGVSEKTICNDESHDHCVGGKNDMYYLNDLFESRAELVSRLRSTYPDMHITLCCHSNVSPFWRQWVNTVCDLSYADNTFDINSGSDDVSKPEKSLTYTDAVYYNQMCDNALQIPADSTVLTLDNGLNLSNDEFLKFAMWSVVRGEGEVMLTPSVTGLDDSKRAALSRALKFKEESQHILKNARFIGGRPDEGNIYGFVSWTDNGEGVIALRNPSEEKTPLTLTLNKLMGVPENLEDVSRVNVYSVTIPETLKTYSYGDKIDITLHPFECVIFKFTK
ncbi:MAG: hypothetical protein E7571_04115 [Ruminococcaceae bacterium]|nr:hypothetical protein [Oscillospiraceae bacterium]